LPNQQELHAIEQELHIEILPGTEIMADIGSHHFVKGAGSQKVLVPQPSDDPHDVSILFVTRDFHNVFGNEEAGLLIMPRPL